MDKIVEMLFKMQDLKYRDFSSKLIPNIDKNTIIGVRTPDVKKMAKDVNKSSDRNIFMANLPHKYYDENILHACLISLNKDINNIITELEVFLPYVDNWAVCDMISPKAFNNDKEKAYKWIIKSLKSKNTYTIRFSIVSLLSYYLDDSFKKEMNEIISKIKSKEYYINMAIAWYYSYALIFQYKDTIKYFEEKKLDKWIHNKSIQKAIESYRVDKETKAYLKSIRLSKGE